MSKHDHLRQGGAFPGGLVNALDELDARITKLEQAAPGDPAAANPANIPAAEPEPEPATDPAPADPSVQSPEGQQEPEDGAQGGQN